MLSVAKGYDTKYLTDGVSAGREGYYSGAVAAGEPRGLWYGAGAAELGLSGEVDAELLEAVYAGLLDPRDPAIHDRATWDEATKLGAGHRQYRSADEIYAELVGDEPDAGPERRDELRAHAESSARQAVSFYDVTFSAPKSVTVVAVAFERMANEARAAGDLEAAAAWEAMTNAVEDSVLAGSRAALDYLQDMAGYSRVGHHGGGAGRWTDAHSLVVAQFLQHDSRDRDPQLHVHQAILNRVRCADGMWRALDGSLLYANRAAAGAIAERVMEAYLTRAVGVWFATRPDGKAREIVGVSEEMRDRYSSRRQAIGPRADQLAAEFKARYGRKPNPQQLNDIYQQATLETRQAKSHDGQTHDQQMERWVALADALKVGGLNEIAHDVLRLARDRPPADEWSVRDVLERAIARAAQAKQTWTRSDLLRAVSDELPGHLAVAPEDIRSCLEGLTDQAWELAVAATAEESVEDLPAQLRLANGQSAFSKPGSARRASQGQVVAERILRAAATERGAAALATEHADAAVARFAAAGHPLGKDQESALRGVLTSSARVEVITAAAGTGKSFTIGAINQAWRQSGGRVFGLATAQNAASVLAAEGIPSSNIDRWLGAQQRLAEGRPLGEDRTFALNAGDIVTVDEASMVSTTHLAAIHRLCRAADAKLLLVGDPHQLAPVGPGGALVDIADRGLTYQLSEVRRFSNEWEAAASLRLREGDKAALDVYAKHGRLVEGGTAEQAERKAARAWLADTLAGHESLLLVPSNAQADRLCGQLRAELVRLGKVEEAGVPLGMQGTTAGVGDLIQARRNAWELLGFQGNTAAPINRQCYKVAQLRDDGGLIVVPVIGGVEQCDKPMHLPGDYVDKHVCLAYASTVHAAEGRTVHSGHAVAGPGTDARSLYVMVTRGRATNTLTTVIQALATDAAPGQATELVSRTARSVLGDILDAAELEQSALTQREQAELDMTSVLRHGDRLIVGVGLATADRTATTLDRLVADGVLDPYDRARLAGDEAYGSLEGLLRNAEIAGHDPAEVLTAAVAARNFDGARSVAQTLYGRISSNLRDQLTPKVRSHADLIPNDVPHAWRPWLAQRAVDADERRRVLGIQTAALCPQWARETLGPVPADPASRLEWERKAGYAAAYRELTSHDDEADALGYAPSAGLPEKRALWHAARAALELPDASDEERELSDGQLRMRVRAWQREEFWAPRYVADQLAATCQHAANARRDATVWTAKADAATDPAEAATLRAEAAQAHADAEQLSQLAAHLTSADVARNLWYINTAVTRDNAYRAKTELAWRGVDLTEPDDVTTAQDWLDHQQQQARAEDAHRQIRDEADLDKGHRDELPALDAAGPLVETAVPDIREISTADVREHTDPARRHRPATVAEAAESVARAKAAIVETQARDQYDQAHQHEDANHYQGHAAAHAVSDDEVVVSEC